MANTRPDFLAMASVTVQEPTQAKAQGFRQRFSLGIDRWTGIIIYSLKKMTLIPTSYRLRLSKDADTERGNLSSE